MDLDVLDGRLFHEVLADGDGAVSKIIGLGEYPRIPCGRLLDAVIQGERVLDLFYVVEDVGGSTGKQEQMGDIGVGFRDDIVVR